MNVFIVLEYEDFTSKRIVKVFKDEKESEEFAAKIDGEVEEYFVE